MAIATTDSELEAAALDLARAWLELRRVLPKAPQIRITLRGKTGQVLCAVGRVQRTGTTEQEAIRACAQAIARGARP